jgi:cytochrome c biogenesis protein CcmG, thiol:disulfide interchange protein DsbE
MTAKEVRIEGVSMKRLVVSLGLCLGAMSASALSVGDQVDPKVLAQLQVDPAKVTVIDFFAEWCESCRKELPLISATHGRVDPKRIAFLGVDTDDDLKIAAAFQAEMRGKSALSFSVVNDDKQALVKTFKPRGYPALYILKDGKVVKAHLGAIPNVDEQLARDLKELGVGL